MAERSLEDRVAALEEKVGTKTIQEQFREQAEMLDERFAEVNQSLVLVRSDIGALQKDMTIVREGIKIILKKLS
jgi:hypothetical protein